MSRQDEPVDLGFVVAVARTTDDSHQAGNRCQSCTPDGCKQHAWALDILEQARQDRTELRKRAATW